MNTFEDGKTSHATDQLNQYCETDYTTTNNLYVQNIPILHRDRKINHKVHTEVQKTLNRQSNPEQKEKHWRYHNISILQSHSNKNNMELAQKQNGTE
jgi:hypothetical protein